MKTTVYKSGIPFEIEYTIKGRDVETINLTEVKGAFGNDCTCMCEAFGLWDDFKELVAEKYISNEI